MVAELTVFADKEVVLQELLVLLVLEEEGGVKLAGGLVLVDYQLLLTVTIISGRRKMFTTTLHSISNPTDLLDYICLTTLYRSRNLISLLFFFQP